MTLSLVAPRFEDVSRQAIITVLDLPGPAFPEFHAKLFEARTEPGVKLLGREPFGIAGGLGFLLTLRLEPPGQPASYKWVLLSSTNQKDIVDLTSLVSVDVPDTARDFYTDEKIRAALSSVTYRNVPVEEQLNLLPFQLSDLAGFRVARATATATVTLTDSPQNPDMRSAGMIITVVPQRPPDPSERAGFSVELLRSLALPDLKVTSSETIRLKNQPTFEVRGEARDPQANAPISVVQWVRFGESGFTRIVGISPSAQWGDTFPRFRAVRDGIEPRN